MLRGESAPRSADRVFYWEFHEGGFNRAIRFGDWKAIQFGKPVLMRDDWKRVFDTDEIAASIKRIT